MDRKREIIAIIAEVLNISEEMLTEDSKAEDFVEWDSLAQVMIIGALDEKLGINISLEQAMEIDSIRQILELCQ